MSALLSGATRHDGASRGCAQRRRTAKIAEVLLVEGVVPGINIIENAF